MSRSSQTRAKKRRQLSDEALTAIASLSADELKNMRIEISRQMNIQAQVISDLRSRLDAIRNELASREETWNGYRISDHTIVRYLERFQKMDMAAIKNEIADYIRSSKNSGRGRVRHEATGAIFGTDDRDGKATVTTVFLDAEEAVMKVLPSRV